MNENEEFEFRHRLEQEHSGKSLPEFVGNIGSDLKQMAVGMGSSIKEGAFDMPKRALDTGLQMAAGQPYSETPSGKQDQQLMETAPEQLTEMAKPVTHPLEYSYEHPVQQALNLLAMGSPVMRGAAETGAKYAGQFAEKQVGEIHGTTPGMFKQTAAGQLENPRFSQAMRDSYAEGDANLLRGDIGRKESIAQRIKQYGKELGDLRTEGSEAGPVRTGESMAAKIQKPIGDKFTEGGENFTQEGEFMQQLENIKKMRSTTPSDFAERATAINKAESKGLNQAKNVETDIANQMSRINNEDLATRLGPEKAAREAEIRQKFGSAKSLVPAEIHREGKELRAHQTPNTAFGFAKSAAHSLIGGPKMGAQVGFGLEAGLNNVAKNTGTYAIGGVTSHLMSTLTTNPQSLGRYASPLLKAAQTGGNQGLAATHYILSTTHPDYSQMLRDKETE